MSARLIAPLRSWCSQEIKPKKQTSFLTLRGPMVVVAARLVRAVRALKFRTRVASSSRWTGGRAHFTPVSAADFRAPAPARFPLAHARRQRLRLPPAHARQHRLLSAAPRATPDGGRLPIVPGCDDNHEHDDDDVCVPDEDDEGGAEEYEDAQDEDAEEEAAGAETVISVGNMGGGGGGGGGPPGGATEVSADVCVMDARMGGGGGLAAGAYTRPLLSST